MSSVMKDFREMLQIANQRKLFWPSYLFACVLLIFVPIFLNWIDTNQNIFWDFLFCISLMGLAAAMVANNKALLFNGGVVLLFLTLLWFQSSPTSGLATVFFTESQVEHYKAVAERGDELKQFRDLANKWKQERTKLDFDQIKPHLPNTFGDDIAVGYDSDGQVKIQTLNSRGENDKQN